MYVITAHQRHRQTDRRTDRRTSSDPMTATLLKHVAVKTLQEKNFIKAGWKLQDEKLRELHTASKDWNTKLCGSPDANQFVDQFLDFRTERLSSFLKSAHWYLTRTACCCSLLDVTDDSLFISVASSHRHDIRAVDRRQWQRSRCLILRVRFDRTQMYVDFLFVGD